MGALLVCVKVAFKAKPATKNSSSDELRIRHDCALWFCWLRNAEARVFHLENTTMGMKLAGPHLVSTIIATVSLKPQLPKTEANTGHSLASILRVPGPTRKVHTREK
jgi:hypothetical protein